VERRQLHFHRVVGNLSGIGRQETPRVRKTPSLRDGSVAAELIAAVDEVVRAEGVSRAEAIRRIADRTGRNSVSVASTYYQAVRRGGPATPKPKSPAAARKPKAVPHRSAARPVTTVEERPARPSRAGESSLDDALDAFATAIEAFRAAHAARLARDVALDERQDVVEPKAVELNGPPAPVSSASPVQTPKPGESAAELRAELRRATQGFERARRQTTSALEDAHTTIERLQKERDAIATEAARVAKLERKVASLTSAHLAAVQRTRRAELAAMQTRKELQVALAPPPPHPAHELHGGFGPIDALHANGESVRFRVVLGRRVVDEAPEIEVIRR
jgi:hypothetical protein